MEGDNLGLLQLPLALLRHKEAWILRIVMHGMTQRGALSYLALLYPMRQSNLLINAFRQVVRVAKVTLLDRECLGVHILLLHLLFLALYHPVPT